MTCQATKKKNPYIICGIPILLFLLESVRVNAFDSLSLVLTKQFHVNAFQYARLSSVYLLGNLIFLIPYGILLDRIATKKLLIFSATLCSLTAFFEAFVQSYKIMLLLCFIAGIGASPIFIVSVKLIKEWFAEKKLALLTGTLVCAAMVGGVLAQTPVLVFIHYFAWHNIFFILGLLEISMALLACYYVETPYRRDDENEMTIIQVLKDFVKTLKNVTNWLSGLFTSLLNLPVTLIGAIWGQAYLQAADHFSAKQSSVIISFIFIGLILGLPAVGYASDKTKNRTTYMMLGTIVCLICSILILILTTNSMIIFISIFFMFGVASSVQTLGYTVACESNPVQRIGVAMGLVGVIVMCGGTFLQPLIGFMLDRGRVITNVNNILQYGSHDYRVTFLLFPISFFIAILLVFALKVKRK